MRYIKKNLNGVLHIILNFLTEIKGVIVMKKISLIFTAKATNRTTIKQMAEKAIEYWNSLSRKEKLAQAKENGRGYFRYDGDLWARF